MGEVTVTQEMLAAKYAAIFPHLDERQRRLLLGAEARVLGHGGIRLVARAAGVREATVSLGVDELEAGAEPLGRARRPGGGRKRRRTPIRGWSRRCWPWWRPDERGDPVSPLRWTTKSTRNLAGELTAAGASGLRGHGAADAARAGVQPAGQRQDHRGERHPDRDAQFRYISGTAKEYLAAGDPVVSVDAKKKEQVGQYAQNGAGVAAGGRPGPGPRP